LKIWPKVPYDTGGGRVADDLLQDPPRFTAGAPNMGRKAASLHSERMHYILVTIKLYSRTITHRREGK
jgi:hypothetical protein